jgi:hypothetical protein
MVQMVYPLFPGISFTARERAETPSWSHDSRVLREACPSDDERAAQCDHVLDQPRQVAGALQHALDSHRFLPGQVAIQHEIAPMHRHP